MVIKVGGGSKQWMQWGASASVSRRKPSKETGRLRAPFKAEAIGCRTARGSDPHGCSTDCLPSSVVEVHRLEFLVKAISGPIQASLLQRFKLSFWQIII